MSDCCFKKNDLLIAGTRQDGRLYPALDPGAVLPDERSIEDLLVFISKYAELINFFALKGDDQKDYVIEGNWKPLILSDEAFNYAGISVTPYTLPNITFYKYVNLYETGSTTAKRNAAYRVLWDILLSVYKEIDRFYAALPVYMGLRNEIAAEINNGLAADLGIAAGAYLNDISALATLNLQAPTSSADDDFAFGYAYDIINGGFSTVWIDASLAPAAKIWKDYLLFLNPKPLLAQSFFNTAALVAESDRIDYSMLQLKQIFKRSFEAYARIINRAGEYLQYSLTQNASHQAHHGLLLAFLQLFGVLVNDFNLFTRKHLEYYYSRVLRIAPRPATADAVHMIIEPAKLVQPSHLVKKGTALNAGKDGSGKLLLYLTDDEIAINQGKVAEIKSIYLRPGSTGGMIEKVFASPVANSSDGKGGEFTGDDISWRGFGDRRIQSQGIMQETNIADLGFYIASPVLHLTEGKRIIEFDFNTDAAGKAKAAAITQANWIKLFHIYFSGEKQWEPLLIDNGSAPDFNSLLAFSAPTATSFRLTLTLLPQFMPVVGYDGTLYTDHLNTVFPVAKFILKQDGDVANAYDLLKDIVISSVSIKTIVEGMTGLTVQNELGILDPSKPVLPFGPLPKKGSAFYIGHAELEHKNLSSLVASLEWLDLKADLAAYYKYKKFDGTSGQDIVYLPGITGNSSFKVKAELLRNKEWRPSAVSDADLFSSSGITVSFASEALKKSLSGSGRYLKAPLAFSPETQHGFVRITLTAPADAFGHQLWPMLFAQQTVAITKDADPAHNTIPNPPYTPLLNGLKLNYTATQQIQLGSSYQAEQGQFFHLTPFGHRLAVNDATFMPAFMMQKKQADSTMVQAMIESAVFVGISDAEADQTISLLVQVNEGSEDISVDPPVITWNYLSDSGWKHFDRLLLADSTESLLKSGIIRFKVPTDLSKGQTELPSGLAWICAAVEPDFTAFPKVSSLGLPKMVGWHTNAVKASFSNNGNDPEHLAKALPAGLITKLYESDAAVKKVRQPYASFGGKKQEEGNRFYTRVSERLRHKNRAITIWDHERLVLNEFPEVYMVKCLNHTGYEIHCDLPQNDPCYKSYKENIPGQVMLVPVPFVTNLQTGNIFQPTFSAAKLTDIYHFIHGNNNAGGCNKYIKALHCQLAKLWVENPRYETIEVTCKIRVRECLDPLFYKNKLVEDLNAFLSPWITGDPGKINFGGRLHASQVVYFIEQLPYIEYLEDLSIEHRDNNNSKLNIGEPSLAIATTSRSVLTSFGSHGIQLI